MPHNEPIRDYDADAPGVLDRIHEAARRVNHVLRGHLPAISIDEVILALVVLALCLVLCWTSGRHNPGSAAQSGPDVTNLR